ncbi:MAG: iron ABC transporter permease [Chloroflexi bacterium]|nr:iron ABC transporter permease [Chloroflexota bacterium]
MTTQAGVGPSLHTSTVERRSGGRRLPPPPASVWVPAALVAAVMLLPLAYLVVRAAGAGSEALEFVFRPRTAGLFLRTAGLALAVTVASAAIAIPLAWLTVRTDLPFRRLWSVLATLPLVIPTYVGGFVIVASLGPRGLLQKLLESLWGIERLPEIYGFPGAMLALTLFTYPYLLLTVRAGLQGIDPASEEASRSLGDGPWATFFRVTLPQLRPAIASGSLIVALYTLSDFGAVSLLRFDSFTRAIYLQYQGSFDRTMAAVLALLLVVLTLAILTAEGWSRGRRMYHRSTPGAARVARTLTLGRWRSPALLFCAGVVFLALIVPVAVLIYWLSQGLLAGNAFKTVGGAAVSSVYASGLAGIVAVAAALPVSLLSVRWPGKTSALLERATYSGYALPGIVVALALVFFGANYATFLYQTLALLVVAYVVRFLPQAVGAARSSLLQVSPSLEDAARSLGQPPLGVMAKITIPLIRNGLLAGAALVFLTAMKELPATLLLSPIGFKTLATTIWTATAEGFFAEAALPALILILVSGISLIFMFHPARGRTGHGDVE